MTHKQSVYNFYAGFAALQTVIVSNNPAKERKTSQEAVRMNGSTESNVVDVGIEASSKVCDIIDPVQFIMVPLVYIMVLCIGLPGNFIALMVFLLDKDKIGKAIRVYLINLTVADILFNISLPFWIVYYLKGGDWTFGDVVCRMTGAIYYLATYSAITFMTIISFNRYCTILQCKVKLSLNSYKGAICICVVAWLFWIGCAIPSLLEKQTTFKTGNSIIKCFEQFSDHKNFAFASVGFFVLSFTLVLVTYVSVMRSLSASNPSQSQGTHRRLAKIMVLGMVVVFVVCIAPYHIILVPWVMGRTLSLDCVSSSIIDILHWVSIALLSLNSCIDPLIYCFSVKRFRVDFLKTIRKIILCLSFQPSSSDSYEHHPVGSISYTSS
nr:PREDICTED: platelet-activating factor receptor-like [Latimeria chalumnae]|eukprot:XP_005988588.2 PREDICTED: platelet-activating factor receptor-like [Latimeria chalumnae]